MKERGEIVYNGRRNISTAQTEMESPSKYMKVLGYVACGEGQEEEKTVIEYIRMPKSIVGKGNFFALMRCPASVTTSTTFTQPIHLRRSELCRKRRVNEANR